MKKRSYRSILGALLVLWALAGCTTLSDRAFLIRKLDDPAKSKALTDQGIARYQLYLVTRRQYDKIKEIRSFFVVALRYDPDNLKAQQYLELVDNFKSTEARKHLKEAEKYIQKGKRKEEEDYLLSLAVQRAFQLDPDNEDVVRLRKDTAEIRVRLVEVYVTRSKSSLEQVQEKTPLETREKLYLEAVRSISRALAIDPRNSIAQQEKRSMRSEVEQMFSHRLEAAKKKMEAGSFSEARKEVVLLEELNRRLEGSLDQKVSEVGYSLNYRWARSLFERKEYAQAQVKADAALAVKRTDEAVALKRKIVQARAQSEAVGSFETGLAQIDKLIQQGDLSGAHRKLNTLARGTKERAKLQNLEQRREKLRSQLPGLYEQAVGLYKAEDYKGAAELLEIILQIDVEYEQAAEYLDKAKSKKKLLEQYGGDS